MLKSYEELRQIDVKPYCKPRDGFLYLNWAKCIDLLHENGAEVVYFEPIPDEKTGNSLRMTSEAFTDSKGGVNRCYETRIRVVIDDKEYIMQTPVMNGTNPVKDNSLNQNRVWTSMCRAFVKCVAIHTGLGFSLWLDEEMSEGKFEEDIPEVDQPATEPQKKCINDYANAYHLDVDAWLAMNHVTMDTLTDKQAGKMLYALNAKYGELGDEKVQKNDGKNG